jgi:hypothetical protein
VISKATGKPWCRACKQRWTRCAGCGETGRVRGGTPSEPLCSACTRRDPGFWRSCPGCGQPRRIHAGRCGRCTVEQRLRDLLGNKDGEIRPQLQALYHALDTAGRPGTVAAWLDKSAAPAILDSLDPARQLSHRVLDELPPGKTVEHLRSVLVAIGTLPPRDEQMTRLNHWIACVIGECPDPGQQQLLHRYAVWHVVRRLRGRLGGTRATHGQVVAAQRIIKAAIALLDWLTAHDLTLAAARQGDLEAWLASAQASHRTDAGNFVRWARKQKLASMDFAAVRWAGPTGVIDTETRWEQARWLLHDGTLKPEDRVAGLLVLLYAQNAAAVSRLTTGHIQASGNDVRIRLGREPVVLPRAARRPGPAGRHRPARPCRHRRPGNLPVAVPRRAARTPDQRLPARRTSPPARRPLRAVPFGRAVAARHRPARCAVRPAARHPHQRRRRMAARLGRGLDGLRSRRQPTRHRPPSAPRRRRTHPSLRGIQTVAISDVARADRRRPPPRRGRQGDRDGLRPARQPDLAGRRRCWTPSTPRYAIGEVAVPYGRCAEPSNVAAGGGACPIRFRCAGCDHFRTDVFYLPDLTAYLDDLLRTRERLAAAIDGVDDWARADATSAQQEITRIRRLISQIEGGLDGLAGTERGAVDDAVAAVRRHRAVSLGMPAVRSTATANTEATA